MTILTLAGVLGTQELIIILVFLLKVGLLLILPVMFAYRLGKKAGRAEVLDIQRNQTTPSASESSL